MLIARNRGFWSTSICADYFPLRLLLRPNAGRIEQLFYAIWGIFLIVWNKPHFLVLGTSTGIVHIFAILRKIGFFYKLKIITDKQYITEQDAKYMDKIIVYSPGEIDQYPEYLKQKFVFLHYPSKTELVDIKDKEESGDYLFCGGSNMRDHTSFLEAIDGLPIRVVIVTDKKLPSHIPSNCKVYGRLPLDQYMNLMAGARVVAVSLFESKLPHGYCDISSALSLGRPVITTKGASADSYVVERKNGLFVSPGDVVGYRKAVMEIFDDKELYFAMSRYTALHAQDFFYETFGKKLYRICQKI